jgi:D-tyrosyl-tRNA(Tyr) deacylase
MKALIQRVTNAKVHINGITKGSINKGLVIFIGFADSDTFEKIEWVVKKIAKLRIFTDQEGKMNNSVEDVQGELLIISQFTLYASVKKGTRPSFIEAAESILAENLYNYFIEYARKQTTLNIETGSFGADMKVELTNDGPVTILVEK